MNVNMKKEKNDFSYLPPKLVFVEISEIIEELGPAISCSGYGGSVTGCN